MRVRDRERHTHTEKEMSGRKHNADSSKRSPVPPETEMFGEFQDWCLRTYGDSAKTKTVTRRKYDKILQALSLGEDSDAYTDGSHINAKFKFWVKSKGFQVRNGDNQRDRNGKSDRPVLYVPIKATVSRLRVSLYTPLLLLLLSPPSYLALRLCA